MYCRVTCHIVSDLLCWNARSTVKYTLIDKVEKIVHEEILLITVLSRMSSQGTSLLASAFRK